MIETIIFGMCYAATFCVVAVIIWLNNLQNEKVRDYRRQVDLENTIRSTGGTYKPKIPECYQHLDSKYHADDKMFEYEEKIHFTMHNGFRSLVCPCCGYENIFTVATAIEYINGYTGSCKFQDLDCDLYECFRVKYYCLACKTPIALDINIEIDEPYSHSEEDEEMEYEEEDY